MRPYKLGKPIRRSPETDGPGYVFLSEMGNRQNARLQPFVRQTRFGNIHPAASTVCPQAGEGVKKQGLISITTLRCAMSFP